jgi:predicted ATPase
VAEYEGLLRSYPANGYEVELIPKAGVNERADFLEKRIRRLRPEHRDRPLEA